MIPRRMAIRDLLSVRVAFFGTSDFAVAVLRRLADSEFRPALVVTPPDRRSGRGRRLRPPPAAEAARALGLELVQAESVNRPDAVAAIRAAEPEVAVVCAFGQLIREPLLGELEMLNVHPSLLPRWRGAAPIERAILAGDEETGVTVMRLGEGLDSGPIALQRRVAIGATETCGALATRLAELGGELVVATLELRREGLTFAEQDEAAATYAEKIAPEERRLDPRRRADELARRVRALTPHIGAYLELAGGGRLGVHAAEPVSSGPPAGELAAEGELVLGCGEGALRMLEVQPPGGRPMAADAYLRGHRVPALAER